MTLGFTVLQAIVIRTGHQGFSVFSVLWLSFFCYLVFNVSYTLVHTMYVIFTNYIPFKEKYLSEVPRTAVLYFIRRESSGLFERMEYTLRCNFLDNVDFWIVSGASDERHMEYETSVVQRLKAKFTDSRVKYLHSDNPQMRKREMMDLWLDEYSDGYKYFIACDADSMLPPNTLLKLLRKGEHPENQDIGVFQTSIEIVNTHTYYSWVRSKGLKMWMDHFFPATQAIFNHVLSFGHNCLTRVEPFRAVKIPPGVLSHDIWDTVYLDRMGYRTVYCRDVVSYEEMPANYIEDIKRSGRWARGNMETIRLLCEKGLSTASRFHVFFGIHMYFSQLILLFWTFSGIWISRMAIWGSTIGLSLYLKFIIMGIIFLHKFTLCRRLRDVFEVLVEIMFSTVMGLNNLFYTSSSLILLPFKKAIWIPMKKNPYQSAAFNYIVRSLWQSTLCGLLGIWVGVKFAPGWGKVSAPVLFSFTVGIPIAYLSAKAIRPRLEKVRS